MEKSIVCILDVCHISSQMKFGPNFSHPMILVIFIVRGAVKKYLADFFREGGGVPPFPLRVFGQDDFPLRGGGYPPIPLRKKSAKKRPLLA